MKLVFLIIFIFSFHAISAEKTKTSSPSKNSVVATSVSSEASSTTSNSLYLHVIPYHSDVGLGALFEHMTSENLGVGGGLMYLPKERSDGIPGLTSFIFNVRGHITYQSVDFHIAPGLSVQMHDGIIGAAEAKTRTTLGSSVAIGGSFQFDKNASFGVEHSWNYSWFDKKTQMNSRLYNGNNSSFFLRLKF